MVSLDYVKTSERRDHFIQACPDFVIVDEAHTCAAAGQRRHQRRELLQGLAASPSRHLVLLTATPHSGDDAAFYRLLGLLSPDFERLAEVEGGARQRLRNRLARHFVQRRRPDIAEWHDGDIFPRRETRELTYQLSGAWDAFLQRRARLLRGGGGDGRRRRVAPTPQLLGNAGPTALHRVEPPCGGAGTAHPRRRGSGATRPGKICSTAFSTAMPTPSWRTTWSPPAGGDAPALARLIRQAERLAGQSGDPKLRTASLHVAELVSEGFNVVVFCRFIATAHYVARHFGATLKDAAVRVVTGELPPEERAARVAEIGATAGARILVATDCLSEGVNLQDYFDAVVHYDLSWNPTRHEQREGRVDRFGQPSKTVRATLLYGDNPIDGAVLQVILRKAARIREELGVPVPVPDEGHSLTQALLKAVLLRRRGRSAEAEGRQLELFEDHWRDTRAKARRNRTLFAQRRISPEDVLPEWHKSRSALGSREEVARFASRALARLGSGLEPLARGYKVPTTPLPAEVRELLETEGMAGTVAIDFAYPAAPGCRPVQRSHPLVSVLAETLLARTLSVDGNGAMASDPAVLGRVGCWISGAVRARSTIVLLRLRHQLVTRTRHGETTLMVEEAAALAWTGAAADPTAEPEAIALLAHAPAGDPPRHVRQREVARALALLRDRAAGLEAFAAVRAGTLLEDHLQVREAGMATGSTTVHALPRPDVIGVYVLLPRVD